MARFSHNHNYSRSSAPGASLTALDRIPVRLPLHSAKLKVLLHSKRRHRQHSYKRLTYLAISVLAVYVLVPQLSIFQHSLGTALQAQPAYVLAALGSNLASYLLAGLTYYLLAFKPIRYRPTVLVQVASMFTNRLLPAGLGGMGANFYYLRRMGYKSSQAISVVGLNNVVGFVGHALLVGLVVLTLPGARRDIPVVHASRTTLLVITIITTLLLIIVALVPTLKQKLFGGISLVASNVRRYRHQPSRLGAALVSSTLLTITNLVCLWLSALAVGVHLSLVAILLVFTFGIALGSVAPTPGGIGGVEAGLVAGMVAYHIPANQALAAVLIFRLINYWFSLLLGGGAFVVAHRRGYL